MHASSTVRNISLSNFSLPGPFNLFFSHPSPPPFFFLALSVVNAGFCVCLQNKISHSSCSSSWTIDAGFNVQSARKINGLQNIYFAAAVGTFATGSGKDG